MSVNMAASIFRRPGGQGVRWPGYQMVETISELGRHHVLIGRARLLVEGVDLLGHGEDRELLHVEGVGGHLGRGGQEKGGEQQQIESKRKQDDTWPRSSSTHLARLAQDISRLCQSSLPSSCFTCILELIPECTSLGAWG